MVTRAWSEIFKSLFPFAKFLIVFIKAFIILIQCKKKSKSNSDYLLPEGGRAFC